MKVKLPNYQDLVEPFLALGMGLGFLLINWSFEGPAYQQDEVGYLVKGAFFGGYVIDGFSSYHVGYSLLLAPVFWLASGPIAAFKGTLIVNALIWALTLWGLAAFLEELDVPRRRRAFALLACAVYPSFVCFSGFALSQGAFAGCFVLSLVSFSRWLKGGESRLLVLHSGAVSYLFWIHPTGLAVIGASLIAMVWVFIKRRKVAPLLSHLTLLLIATGFYKGWLDPWMQALMTPKGFEPRIHYPSTGDLFAMLSRPEFLRDLTLGFLGQGLYLSVASMGAVGMGLWVLYSWVRCANQSDNVQKRVAVAIYIFFSLLLVMVAGDLNFAVLGPYTLDEWFYGRYNEGVILPLLALGLISQKPFPGLRPLLGLILVMILVAGLIQKEATSLAINPLNMLAFWPTTLTDWLKIGGSPLIWFGMGGLGLGLLMIPSPALRLAFIAPVWIACVGSHLNWHQALLQGGSKPSSLIQTVRTQYPKGSCVGFDPVLPDHPTGQVFERIRLYSYYLYDYRFQRITPSNWVTQCEGPLFSFESLSAEIAKLQMLGREEGTGLTLWAKNPR